MIEKFDSELLRNSKLKILNSEPYFRGLVSGLEDNAHILNYLRSLTDCNMRVIPTYYVLDAYRIHNSLP